MVINNQILVKFALRKQNEEINIGNLSKLQNATTRLEIEQTLEMRLNTQLNSDGSGIIVVMGGSEVEEINGIRGGWDKCRIKGNKFLIFNVNIYGKDSQPTKTIREVKIALKKSPV